MKVEPTKEGHYWARMNIETLIEDKIEGDGEGLESFLRDMVKAGLPHEDESRINHCLAMLVEVMSNMRAVLKSANVYDPDQKWPTPEMQIYTLEEAPAGDEKIEPAYVPVPVVASPHAEFVVWTVVHESAVRQVGYSGVHDNGVSLAPGLRVWKHRMGAVTFAGRTGVVWAGGMPQKSEVVAVVLRKPWPEGVEALAHGAFTTCSAKFMRKAEVTGE